MNKLIELRAKRGLSQAELAKILGVKQNTISGWEKGVRHPSISMLRKLADFFDTSIDSLVEERAAV